MQFWVWKIFWLPDCDGKLFVSNETLWLLQLELDDLRLRTVEQYMEGLLEESADLFWKTASVLEDGEGDKWECYYFLAKIGEKLGKPVQEVSELMYSNFLSAFLDFKTLFVFVFIFLLDFLWSDGR